MNYSTKQNGYFSRSKKFKQKENLYQKQSKCSENKSKNSSFLPSINQAYTHTQDFGQFQTNKQENIQVVVRVRPLLKFELKRKDQKCVKVLSQNSIQVQKSHFLKNLRFHKVFSKNCNQKEVFEQSGVTDLLDATLEGFSSTVLAYGQTGSGKTFTIAGFEDNIGVDNYNDSQREGMIPKAVRYLWQKMSQREEKFFIKASFLEIYNELIKFKLSNGQ